MKFVPARSMNTTMVISIIAPLRPETVVKWPIEALYVLKPPVAMVPKAWQRESNSERPWTRSRSVRAAFRPA